MRETHLEDETVDRIVLDWTFGIGLESVDWIHMAEGKDWWLTSVNMQIP
jgi:hypothetical protein